MSEMKKSDVVIPVSMQGESEQVLDKYRELVAGGMAIGMATILASRHFPATKADRGRENNLPPIEQTCGKYYADKIKAEAKAAGINVTDASRYNPTMADSRAGGDPNAWVHAGEGTSTYKQRLLASGGGSEDLGVAHDDARIQERFAKKKAAYHGRRRARRAYAEEFFEKKAKQA